MNNPSPFQYIDAHTHSPRENGYWLQNIFAQDLSNELPGEGPFSTGLHPWHILEVNVMECMENLQKFTTLPQILAIGEIGLDRNKDINFEKQEQIFHDQLGIAEKLNKPVVIHCVKAYSDLLHIRKSNEWKMKWMFHWFNENLNIASELIEMDCYLSFGRSLLHPNGKNAAVFKELPLNRLLLETDDAEITIEEVYKKASELKGITVDEMKINIHDNFRNLFL